MRGEVREEKNQAQEERRRQEEKYFGFRSLLRILLAETILPPTPAVNKLRQTGTTTLSLPLTRPGPLIG